MTYSWVICVISCCLFLSTIFWMRSAKKWFKRQIKVLERKKKELDELIFSATDMVHELNNVSDYVVTAVDAKNAEIREVMNEIDLKIEECRKMFDGEMAVKNVVEFPERKEVVKIQAINNNIPAKSKRDEIRELLSNGTDVSDIAKELGVGKGEVQLILGMTKEYMELAN